MTKSYDGLNNKTKGAWIIHHGQKAHSSIDGGAAFPALETAGRAAALLSSLAATDEITLPKSRVEALAKSAGFNPKLELPRVIDILAEKRLIDKSAGGAVAVVGLTTSATAGHAASIFEELEPSAEEKATIVAAERSTDSPVPFALLTEFLGDEFGLSTADRTDLVDVSSQIGFVDSEGSGSDRLIFNGNVFKRGTTMKVKRIVDSLSSLDLQRVTTVEDKLATKGCLSVADVQRILGDPLFEKLRAAGMYDVHFVHNPHGEFGFVTRPAAFHKFNDPLVDDVFDLAKALVAALFYGMSQSSAGRGKITMLSALLRKLIAGYEVGPATAIGEDYKVLEVKGVIKVRPSGFGYKMKLLKKDVGEMALKVLTTGDVSSENVAARPLPGSMTAFTGPEASRWKFRGKQSVESRKSTRNILETLRTGDSL